MREDEALNVMRQVSALRDAPNNQKSPHLDNLSAVHCSFPDTCRLQRTCVRGYRLHLDSLRAVNKLRNGLASATPKQTSASVAVLELKRQAIEKARELMKDCVALQGDLERSIR